MKTTLKLKSGPEKLDKVSLETTSNVSTQYNNDEEFLLTIRKSRIDEEDPSSVFDPDEDHKFELKIDRTGFGLDNFNIPSFTFLNVEIFTIRVIRGFELKSGKDRLDFFSIQFLYTDKKGESETFSLPQITQFKDRNSTIRIEVIEK